jgi:beta-aspartyl-peptidase (threonine type)
MRRSLPHALPLSLILAFAAGLAFAPGAVRAADGPPRPAWALAVHGGAGVIARDLPEEKKRAYLDALGAALADGRERLARGDRAVDVVEALLRRFEDDPLFNAGKGAVFTADETHELDASIMDGATLACGAVAGVTTVRHPVALARLVMEKSPHVLLAGAGAERFADEMGVERVPNAWFDTPERREQLETWRRQQAAKEAAAKGHGTVGAVALDRAGHLAAATSTGGTTGKRPGRIGDSPIVGAGTYADDRTVAVSCTGSGEEFIRHGVARELAALVEHAGKTPLQAADRLIHETLKPGDGGLIALGRDGAIAFSFNTRGMYRGAADANGRFEVAIWETVEPPPGATAP